MAENAPPPATAKADPPSAPQLTLIVKNQSTVPGPQYFNVFPPTLVVTPPLPPQQQIVMPMLSLATTTARIQPNACNGSRRLQCL